MDALLPNSHRRPRARAPAPRPPSARFTARAARSRHCASVSARIAALSSGTTAGLADSSTTPSPIRIGAAAMSDARPPQTATGRPWRPAPAVVSRDQAQHGRMQRIDLGGELRVACGPWPARTGQDRWCRWRGSRPRRRAGRRSPRRPASRPSRRGLARARQARQRAHRRWRATARISAHAGHHRQQDRAPDRPGGPAGWRAVACAAVPARPGRREPHAGQAPGSPQWASRGRTPACRPPTSRVRMTSGRPTSASAMAW